MLSFIHREKTMFNYFGQVHPRRHHHHSHHHYNRHLGHRPHHRYEQAMMYPMVMDGRPHRVHRDSMLMKKTKIRFKVIF